MSGPVAGERTPSSVVLELDAVRVSWILLGACASIEFAFVLLDYHVNYGKLVEIGAIRRMFNIAREDGLASWFGTTQTMLAGLTLWFIFFVSRRRPEASWKIWAWLILAVFFTYMAIDDGAQIHERLGSTYEALLDEDDEAFSYFPSYAWQFLFLPFFGGIGLFMFAFLWFELRATVTRILLMAAMGCLVLAVGLDFIEGLDSDHPWNAYSIIDDAVDLEDWTRSRFGKSPFATLRHFSKSIEEALEMLANSIFWCLFVRHLAVVAARVELRCKS